MTPDASVSRETSHALRAYWDLVLRWTAAINIIGRASAEDGWRRHIEDSSQLVRHFPPRAVRHCDLGSGGGLPAIPVAIHRRGAGHEDGLIMIEADARKAAFLRTALRTLELPGEVVAERAEVAPPSGACVVTARALAPLPRLLGHVERHLAPGGVAILPKGRGARGEVAEARAAGWSFDLAVHPSATAPDAAVLEVAGLGRRAP